MFKRASGRKRFKQFIQARIPESISDIRGGFRGFFSGEIEVLFRFSDCLEKEIFFAKWEENTGGPRKFYEAIFCDRLKISKVYYHSPSQWLLIDDLHKVALLYIPFWYTVDDFPK